jgi:hypothetical protein
MKDCGGYPGQLIKYMKVSKNGRLIDCMKRVMARSMGKDGVVLTRKVSKANAPVVTINMNWNR